MNTYEEYEKSLASCRCGGKVVLTGGTPGFPTFGIRCLKCGGRWSMNTYSPKEAAEQWGCKSISQYRDIPATKFAEEFLGVKLRWYQKLLLRILDLKGLIL